MSKIATPPCRLIRAAMICLSAGAFSAMAGPGRAHAQAAMCQTQFGACPMPGLFPPGGPCRCSAMPMVWGQVVILGGPGMNGQQPFPGTQQLLQPQYPTAGDQYPRRHPRQAPPQPPPDDDGPDDSD